MNHSRKNFTVIRRRYEQELFENVIPFWLKHSPDHQKGGYFNCLDRDGSVYDTTKYVWLQGRAAWIFSKLYREVDPRPEWLEMAKLGIDFLRQHAMRSDGRVYFRLSREGQPIYLQRKIFSECFYVMALAEYSRAADQPALMNEARTEFEKIWEFAWDWGKVGRPPMPGEVPSQNLAVPMILLNLIEELTDGDVQAYSAERDECIRKMLLHVHPETRKVHENISPQGELIDSPEGRLLNPGHAIEAGWFLQHWAQRLRSPSLTQKAMDIIRWSHDLGWDKEFGGLFYFLDAKGFSPAPLEWSMKLWWPHNEAMYAHLLNYSITQEEVDWEYFSAVDAYAFEHFRDPEYGEWFGYLDRRGEITHRFKGGAYKCAFHVPRALWLCWKLFKRLESQTR